MHCNASTGLETAILTAWQGNVKKVPAECTPHGYAVRPLLFFVESVVAQFIDDVDENKVQAAIPTESPGCSPGNIH